MSFFERFVKRPLRYDDENVIVEKDFGDIPEGASQDKDFLFYREGDKVKIYDRVCDHNGGKLALRRATATCPLHGWELDLKHGYYVNARCKKEPILETFTSNVESHLLPIGKTSREIRSENFTDIKTTKVRFLNHACLLFTSDHLSFATDPWIVGSAFSNGWWLANSSPDDALTALNKCDFIYVSHNHPDHLHKESLEYIRKDMPILTADFLSGSTKRILEQYGFTDIEALDFSTVLTSPDDQFSMTVLKSGDFRDDSGLFFENGVFRCLLTVDSNHLNFGRFPKVDLLCSSFAGGASGFPLCFDNYDQSEKEAILKRNRSAIKATNKANIIGTQAKYFMPYAGFFSEKASRDSYINQHNKKNKIKDFEQLCSSNGAELLDLTTSQIFEFSGTRLTSKLGDCSARVPDCDPDGAISEVESVHSTKLSDCILKYFSGCSFNDDLTVDLIATDESFKVAMTRHLLNFKSNTYRQIDTAAASESIEKDVLSTGQRYLRLRVRSAELFHTLEDGKPWEDLSIGFQCRVYRQPNVYNSEFWFYFSNTYIGNVAALSR